MPRSVEAKALVGAILLFAVLAAYRFYDYWTTGFFVSDEFGYYFNAVHGAIYSDRWFFGWMNIIVFKALGIRNVDSFSFFLPIYIVFFASLTLVLFYKVIKLLGYDEKTVALSIISSMVLVSFVLLSLGFLTEPVGLSMTMLGIYFLVRLSRSRSIKRVIAFSFLASCFFGFAAGTREPYNAFLIAGSLIVPWLSFSKRGELRDSPGLLSNLSLVIVVAAFLVPSAFFLSVPTHAFSQQVAPLSSQLAQSIASNPVTTPPAPTVGNVTSTAAPTIPFYRQFVLTNTLLIFFGGLFLGWGPIAFCIGLAGFVIVLRRSRSHKDMNSRFLLLASLTALGSYFVVSFIYAPDPYYFSFQDYSTVIRFSDTALPAYFLMSPLVMAWVSKRRARTASMAGIFVAFLVVSVPVYEVYAASNFNYVSGQNPFQFGFKTDAALMRDYFTSSGANRQPIHLVGVPYGWVFTPGVQDIGAVDTYSIGESPLFAQLNYSDFTSLRWTRFYIYLNDAEAGQFNSSYLSQIIDGAQSQRAPMPYTVLSAKAVLHRQDFTLYEVGLRWP